MLKNHIAFTLKFLAIFTLLFIVVAFLFPHRTYSRREPSTSALRLAASAQELVQNNAKKCIPYDQGWSYNKKNDNVSNITIDKKTGNITIIGSKKLKHLTLLLTPTTNNMPLGKCPIQDNIIWKCIEPTGTVNTGTLPYECTK